MNRMEWNGIEIDPKQKSFEKNQLEAVAICQSFWLWKMEEIYFDVTIL